MAIRQNRTKEYERLMRLTLERISIGVHEEEGSQVHPNADDGETVAEIAYDHEMGTGRTKDGKPIPRRSWLRDWIDTKLEPGDFLKDLPLDYAPELAQRLEKSITDRVRSGKIPPKNALRTIQEKGHDRTLIGETETFVNAIKAKVIK